MKARVKVRPTGLINGVEWPQVGETVDLPKATVDAMIEVGDLEAIPEKKAAEKPVEKRPASKAGEEKRPAKKS